MEEFPERALPPVEHVVEMFLAGLGVGEVDPLEDVDDDADVGLVGAGDEDFLGGGDGAEVAVRRVLAMDGEVLIPHIIDRQVRERDKISYLASTKISGTSATIAPPKSSRRTGVPAIMYLLS